jgi:hypothetical protein
MHVFVLASVLVLGMTGIATARAVRIWSYQELLDKSDLVVLATPAATNDTEEHIDLPGFSGEHVIGVETKFSLSAVLKGDKALRNLVLHHYRTADGTNIPHVPNGPSFVSFTPADERTAIQRTYILFLLREPDGRYAPVVGQADPGLGIKELVSVGRQERGLEFLSGIPEFRGLSLKMSEDQLKSHIEKHRLYAKKELRQERVTYWVLTPGGENVIVGFSSGECTGIQRMQPIPKQRIKDEIGASEYRAWMAKRNAEPEH